MFKVGDCVQLKSPRIGVDVSILTTDIGTIETVNETKKGYIYRIVFLKQSETLYIDASESELTEYLDNIGIKYNIGDLKPLRLKQGLKSDSGKPPYTLIPATALDLCAEALAYGAKKYSADNFKEGIEYRRLISAALRHIYKFSDGMDLDAESGLPHIGHALATLSMLAYQMQHNSHLDDRFKGQNADNK